MTENENVACLITNSIGKNIKTYVNGQAREDTSALFSVVICSLGDHIEVKISGFLGPKLIGEMKMPANMADYSADRTSIEV